MIRFILSRHRCDSPGLSEDVTYETLLIDDIPDIESRLTRGGHGNGYDYTKLVGIEIVSPEEVER